MSVTLSEARLFGNHLLERLSDKQYEPLLSKLEIVQSKLKDVLYERNEPIPFVFFSSSAIYSNMIYMQDGAAIEVGTVGNEGFTPVELIMGATHATETAVCQVEGKGMRMTLDDFRDAVDGPTPLRHLCECYGQAYLSQVSQSVACNRLHHVEARFARWLLITHDRVQGNDFYLTQEFIAIMLGVHRPSVSVIAAEFQKEGVIQYNRGHMKILDRAQLEAKSCECYGAVRSQFKRLLGISYS